ncbi:methionine ABC transporter ATP-binding protein [Clostridium sp. D2Q-11]|uniref:Methionine ABC transporter ATP-binding protein n=1 Tax=Anaeromonas frigoriresistens TaxID=2683708 RepID=A0A942UU16_9FIRM|nr:methionine ABC transporter ATP-binding protein [Anaeromonas frigoriresistens]MBS4537445.1 methionine ABC transporter ATP-binding protein [Anaeromonas frigoriresistens]
MIKIRNVSKVYKSQDKRIIALRDINLDINKKEIFGVIGLSGAGKSTLIRTINRLEEVDKGQIIVDGVDITSLTKKELLNQRKNIGMIFQHFDLLSSKTVFDNIAFPLQISKVNKQIIYKKVNDLLELVGLSDKKYAYPSQLSGGQKQRVAIARALANDPNLLLCDEATSALDPETTKSILLLLKNLQQTLGLTVVLITHEMEVVKRICDRVAVISDGLIVESGKVDDVFFSPQADITKRFIGAIHNEDIDEINIKLKKNSKLVKLSFIGDSAKKPIISHLIRNYKVDINILSGNIDKLTTTSIGNLTIQINGDINEINSSLTHLSENGVKWEVIENV